MPKGALVGRYIVLSRLGEGAMGVVLAAYDPQLDRKVALKLLSPDAFVGAARSGASARLQREAQALAQLSHVNVVGVHDVGIHGGQVFMAMEFVQGQTLTEWSESPRDWREVLAVFEEAGRGLAAAHAKGLIHRDFKPDNVMIGDDGRTRVMDFGLARAESLDEERGEDRSALGASVRVDLTQAGALMGTPAYMSPRQFSREPATALCDQFAFCVAMYEALFGLRPYDGATLGELEHNVRQGVVQRPPRDRSARSGDPVPRWLRLLCERGFANDSSRRWPSMAALLEAIERGRATARRRRWFAAGGVVLLLGAGGLVGQRIADDAAVQACAEEGASLQELWSPAAQASLEADLSAADPDTGRATAERVMPWIDGFVGSWTGVRSDACEQGTLRAELTPDMLDRARWCLDLQRQELSALLDVFAAADEDIVRRAVMMASSLPLPAECLDRGALNASPPPPSPEVREATAALRSDYMRERRRNSSASYDERIAKAKELLLQAEELDRPELASAIRLMLGGLLSTTGAYGEAEVEASAAYMQAVESRSWLAAANSAIALVTIEGAQARLEAGRSWARHAEAMLSLKGTEAELERAHLLHARARLEWETGSLAEAEALARESIELIQRELGDAHPELFARMGLLANILQKKGSYRDSVDLHRRTLELRIRLLGEDHGDVTASYNNLGASLLRIEELDEAIAMFTKAKARWAREFGPDHMYVLMTSVNIAAVREKQGRFADARAIYEEIMPRLERTLGPEHPNVAMLKSNLGIVYAALGDEERALESHREGLAIREKVLGPAHPDTALSLEGVATMLLLRGDRAGAAEAFERVVAIREEALDPKSEWLGNAVAALGSTRRLLGQAEEGRELLVRARRIFEEGEMTGREAYRKVLHDLVELELAEGRPSQALPLCERALQPWSEGRAPEVFANLHLSCAEALWSTEGAEQDRVRARELAAAALEMLDGEANESPARAEARAEARAWIEGHPL